jgi:hypothetical protein
MLILKGILTLNIEVDYATMLDPQNQGAVYMFTGAKSVEEMVKIHMDSLGAELIDILKTKPLVTYHLDGKLRQDVPQPVEEIPTVEAVEEIVDEMPPEPYIEEITGVEEPAVAEPSFELVEKLDEAIEHVSLELGIPQKIKASGALMEQLEALSRDDVRGDVIAEYKGFPVEQEGMEEPFIVVYKTYSGSDVKFFS